MRNVVKLLCGAALTCYAASFFLPTFGISAEGNVEVQDGSQAFLASLLTPLSWLGVGGLKAFVVWLANLAFWAGGVFLFVGSRRKAFAASSGALVLGCLHLSAPLIYVGYYVWLASFVLLALGCGVRLLPS